MTTYQQIALFQEHALASESKRSGGLYLSFAGLSMAAGTVVLFEPAPYDIALLGLLFGGLLLNKLSFRAAHAVPALLLLGFLISNVVMLPWVTDVHVGVGYAAINLYMALSWLFFAGLATADGHRATRALMWGYSFAGWSTALLATLAFFRMIPYQDVFLRFGRAQGFFKDPNVYGPYLVPALLFALVNLQRSKIGGLRFLFGLFVGAICTVGIFLSFSRAAWINTAVAISFFLVLQFLHDTVTRRISAGTVCGVLAIVILACGVAWVTLSGASGLGRILNDRLGSDGLHNYDNDRFHTQSLAIDTVLHRPWGIGPGHSEIEFNYSTHNMYLRVLAENGVLGFITFYAFVFLSLFRAAKLALTLPDRLSRNHFAVLSACLLGLLINGLVIDTIHWRHLWFLLGMAWWVPGNTEKAS